MTPEERQMLSGLFDRIRSASSGPKDREAEAFIEDAMRNSPSAGYVLTQTVLVQQQALEAAARHIAELEAQAKEAPAQQETSFLGNIGRSLFGGGPAPGSQPQARPYDARGYERDAGPPPGNAPQRPGYAPPPPGYGQQPPGYAPPPQQGGPWGAPPPAQGGGFLHGALQTATGVAGGVLLGNALGGLFGGHGGGAGGGGLFGGGSAFAQPRETVNNYFGTDSVAQRDQDYLQDQDQDQDAMQDADDNYASDDDSGGGDDYA